MLDVLIHGAGPELGRDVALTALRVAMKDGDNRKRRGYWDRLAKAASGVLGYGTVYDVEF